MRSSTLRSAPSRAGSRSAVAQLQASAGNRAVAELMTSDAGTGMELSPIDALAAGGNRAALRLLPVQRDDKQPDAKTDAKPDAKAAAKPDTKALRKAWADAGLVAGGPLFDLINDDLSVAKLLDMGLPELAGLAGTGAAAGFDKATEAGGSKGQVKPVGLETGEVKQVGEALAGWAVKAADKWLKSDAGKKFLAKAQGFINEHPKAAYWTIVSTLALGIGGAVTGYFMGAFDPKEFKKSFEIRGLKIDAAVDLGNFKERVLQSGKLAMSGVAGPGVLGIEGSAKTATEGKGKDAKTGYDLGVTGSYKLGDEKKDAPSGKVTAGYGYNTIKDQSQVSLGAGFKYKPLTLDTTWKFQGDGSGVLDTSVTGKLSDNLTLTAGTTVGAYGPASRDTPLGYKLALTSTKGKDSDKVTLDMDPKTKIVTFGTEQTRQLWGGALTTSTGQNMLGAGMNAGASYARNALKLDLKYTVDKAGKETLDVGASGKGEGVDAAFAGKFGLDTGDLEQLTVKLGFTNTDETLKFLHEMSIDVASGKVEAKATETIKLRLKQIALEIKGSLGESKGKAGPAEARIDVGWKLPSGLILGAGFGGSYTPGKEGVPAPWLVGPNVSVSHEALPIRLVGGVNVPVGPGSEGMPPVFGLSVSPNFEFWSEKKKK
jgi:hypothetical protein